jgi:hypothetical protein
MGEAACISIVGGILVFYAGEQPSLGDMHSRNRVLALNLGPRGHNIGH